MSPLSWKARPSCRGWTGKARPGAGPDFLPHFQVPVERHGPAPALHEAQDVALEAEVEAGVHSSGSNQGSSTSASAPKTSPSKKN